MKTAQKFVQVLVGITATMVAITICFVIFCGCIKLILLVLTWLAGVALVA